MSKKKQDDNWALLASELGLEGNASPNEESIEVVSEISSEESSGVEKENVRETVVSAAVETASTEENVEMQGGFGAGILDDAPKTRSEKRPFETKTSLDSETAAPTEPKEKKKTFFGRFPKINLFGSSAAKEPSGGEGTKNSSSSGKSFTSKTLEKVPVPPGRSERSEKAETEISPKRKNRSVDDGDNPAQKSRSDRPVESGSDSNSDPWSQIASQVGVLGGAKPVPTSQKTGPKSDASKSDASKPQRGRRSRQEDLKTDRPEKRREGRSTSNFFDDVSKENEESLALKNLIGDESKDYDEAAQRLSSIFGDGLDESTGDSAGESAPESREEDRGKARGIRHRGRRENTSREENVSSTSEESWSRRSEFDDEKDDFSENSPERSSERRGRGRRGSRYAEREEILSDLDAEIPAWDIEEESKPVERNPRRQRNSRSEEQTESRRRSSNRRNSGPENEDAGGEEFDFSRVHVDIPSWDDAISVIIDGNVARHGQRTESRRGRR